MTEPTARYVVSVLAKDRVGVIADVTDALYGLGANLDALSQTVVWHWFTMITCATVPASVSADQIEKAIEARGLTATVLPFGESPTSSCFPGEPFVVTVIGADRPGIVRGLTRCFAEKGVNIEDVWNEVQEGQFVVIFHVTVPRDIDHKELRYDLDQVAAGLQVSVMLQHQDIFTATNSLRLRGR